MTTNDDVRFVVNVISNDPELKESKTLFNIILQEFASTKEIYKQNKYLALLFDQPSCLATKLQSKELSEDVKKDGLDFFTKLITQAPLLLSSSLPRIKSCSESLLFVSSSAKVRMAALTCIGACLKHATGTPAAAELKVESLCERIFQELTVRQASEGVLQGLHHALSTVCKYYPEVFQNYETKFSNYVVKSLAQKVKADSAKVQFAVIASLMECLSSLLTHFQLNESACKQVYQQVVMVIAGKNYQRYEAPKQALILFANHCSIFSSYLLDDYKKLFELFFDWSVHRNRDMMHVGMLAFDAYVKEVAGLVARATLDLEVEGGSSCQAQHKQLFVFFFQKFRQILDSDGSSWKTVSVAIRGFGYFAQAARRLLSPSDMRQLYSEVVQRAEDVFISEADSIDERLSNLPSFVESLSNLALHLDSLSGVFLSLLARLSVTLCHMYPRVSDRMGAVGLRAIAHVLHRLRQRPGVVKKFAGQVGEE